jgi:serine/threonine protein kinase
MPPVPTADSNTNRPYTKAAGAEPLPGYKLLAPLGRGGFGEVWKCEAPGGLHKAIKFVTSESEDGRGGERFGQELAAFEQIKAIRHPFLLTLERVEQISGELIMVMELADRQLQDRFRECRTCGLAGIPRDELLAYFADAAEALDMIAGKFNLQHLDIKPANLFLVAGHVKVGDYGLVAQLEGPDAGNRGLTPRYVAPEVLHGTPSNCSDQYSLALVYQELLTGEFPYPGRTPQQLMLQHVSSLPNLSPLPPCDQQVVAVALAKRPDERFPSCLAFVQALMSVDSGTSLPSAGMNVRRARVDRSVAESGVGPNGSYAGEESVDGRGHTTHPSQVRGPGATQHFTLPGKPSLTVPGRTHNTLPPLVSANRGPNPSRLVAPAAAPPTPPPSRVVTPPPAADEPAEAGLIVLERISSVLPVASLIGMDSGEEALDPYTFATAVVATAAGAGQVPTNPGEVGRLADGTWVCQFPSTAPPTVVPLKLSVVRDHWGVSIEHPDPSHVVMRRTVGGGGMFGGKKFGYEVSVRLPPVGRAVWEVTVLGRTFGQPDPKCAREAADVLPKMLESVRGQLGNAQDRRRHPRLACGLAATVYPIHSDGGIDAPVDVRCRDVSIGGVGFAAHAAVPTKYLYITFPAVAATAGQAILLRLIRATTVGTERHYGAQYRTDL